MSQSTLSYEIATLRNHGGYFLADDFGLIKITGVDAPKFLQAQTANNVLALEENQGQLNCLLDRKAYLKALFHLFKLNDTFYIIVEKDQIQTILSQLEMYKFNDKVEFFDLSENGSFFVIQGSEVSKFIRQNLAHTAALTFAQSVTGEVGYFLWIEKEQVKKFLPMAEKACTDLGFTKLSKVDLDIARIEAGIPKFNIDLSEENLLPESGIENTAASYTKGCFIGQEVLARIKSHGAPTRALVGLRFANREELTTNSQIIVDGKEIATIKSNCFSPTLNTTIAFAFVKREYRIANHSFTGELNGKSVQVTVIFLPFYHAESVNLRARKLYDKALTLFAKESDLEIESPAVKLLREALDLDPYLEDAYEALGVILSKRDRLDEAIILMKKLAKLNPDSAMAHTNLSIFYVQQGLKEEAEEEKAISMSIRMRLAAQQVNLTKQKETHKQKEREATLERMEMFKQVIAIDAEDLLANSGLGSCLVDLEQYSEAIPYLLKAIEVKPIHTVAYLALGKAYEALGKNAEAISTLTKGIEVASKRGDMEPLRKMQDKLTHLQVS